MGDLTSQQADYGSEQFDIGQQFIPQDAIAISVKSATMTGGAGLLVAAAQNTMSRTNVGAFGVFTRFGNTIALFAAMGGTYAFISTASANLREKRDPWNHAMGGFVAGALVGLRKRSLPSLLGNGAALGVILAGVQFAGGSFLTEPPAGADDDRYYTKEEIKRRFRRPLNETINELGEGRGIYGPGYAERRRQRIKEAYGIDVPEPYYSSK